MDITLISKNASAQLPVSEKPELKTAKTPAEALALSKSVVMQTKTDMPGDSVTLVSALPDKTLQLGQLAEVSNNTAIKIKETDQKLGAVATVVDRMRQTLGSIIKNYPPFPPESQERMELLMSYASIQKELIQMTVPPPPPHVYEKVKSLWQDLFSDNSPALPKLSPSLDSGTPDSVIAATVNELDRIYERIGSIRAAVKQSLSET